MPSTRRIFTLSEAQAALPRIKDLTARYAEEVEDLQALRDAGEGGPGGVTEIDARLEALVRSWAAEIVDLGAEPKGLWLVDFDSGDGFFYCWRLGEERIEHVHAYDSGFSGRRFIGPGP